MIRKILIFISLTFIAIISMMAMNAEWYKYPLYCDNIDQVVETSTKVYFISGGNLFSFSPADNESYSYNHLNKLNDRDITSLYYNAEKKFLLIVYANSNMDLMFDDGEVINLPEIKDSSISSSKTINDVAFGNGLMAIAADFGIVIYDDERFEVKESGIYDKVINSIAIMGNRLVIYGHTGTEFSFLSAPIDERHNNLDKFTKIFGWAVSDLVSLTDDILAFRDLSSHKLYMVKFDFENDKNTRLLNGEYAYDYPIRTCKDGYYTRSVDKLLVFNGESIDTYNIPEALRQSLIAYYDDPEKIWFGDADGIARYEVSGDTPTVLYDKMIYPNYITDKRVAFMKWSPDNKRLYITNRENTTYYKLDVKEGSPNYQTTNIIDGDKLIDASLKQASATHSYSLKYQKMFNNQRMYSDPLMVIEDYDDPDKYYCANNFEGVYVIRRNQQTGQYEEIGKFNSDNSPMAYNYGCRAKYLDYDREGNLWIGNQFGSILTVLPAAKRQQDPSTITAADWVPHSKLADLNYSARDFAGVICRKSNMIFYSMAMYEDGFIAIDTKGTYTDPDDDVVYHWSKVVDQDGNEVMYTYITSFVEDERGCVWVGTTAGVFEITNPSDATNPNMRVRRIKVPRNDGTNFADYLLGSDKIYCMALDPSDRKWIGTEGSGLFLVSETGDAILSQYTTDNSPLLSNTIWSVSCSPTDNTVYVGTDYGLLSFKSDSSPGQDDYSDIYAYPNPVRPEYSGMVTITGLMDNSVVKITDTVGNVVFETRSEGGMAIWDVCNNGGDRVRSGVYYVYASQSNDSGSVGAVTKILVIN